MFILALDIASVTGWCFGQSDAAPQDLEGGSVRLRLPFEEHELAAVNIAGFIREQFLCGLRPRPDVVVAEAMMPLTGQQSEDAARVAMAAHTGLWAVCWQQSLRLERIAASTVRKHFVGQARDKAGNIKTMVRDRAAQLGYCDRTERDFNFTDAVACWDWGKAHIARRPPRELVMFGGAA